MILCRQILYLFPGGCKVLSEYDIIALAMNIIIRTCTLFSLSLGALLGWAILQRIFGPPVYGIAFGIIAGMMVYISLKEIIPTAHKFDKTNGIMVAIFLVVGMIVMALSLVLLAY